MEIYFYGCVVVGILGLIGTTGYELWLGASLKDPSMTRLLFFGAVSLKWLVLLLLGFLVFNTVFTGVLDADTRLLIRTIMATYLVCQVLGVSIALTRWQRRI